MQYTVTDMKRRKEDGNEVLQKAGEVKSLTFEVKGRAEKQGYSKRRGGGTVTDRGIA